MVGLSSTAARLLKYIFRLFFFRCGTELIGLHSFPTRRSSDLTDGAHGKSGLTISLSPVRIFLQFPRFRLRLARPRSEEHTSELQSRFDLVCRLLLEKKKKQRRV